MSNKLSVDNFISVLQKSGLVENERLKRAVSEFQASVENGNASILAERLVAANLLTNWQTEKLLQGKHRGYFLGKYKLLSLLGKGGMSSVFLAEHLVMRRRCALKVLPAKRVDDSSYLERFHREAQAAASLDHPNIVRAYDVDHQNDGDKQIHFLVMEYVEGTSLQELVPTKGMSSFLDSAEYTRQAALGLQHAHENGMVHRDIKPGNLLVDPNGVVKVLDLGLARFFKVDEGNEALTIRHDEKVLGTADYLAPEQALDSHTVDSRADIYALGCTLYFMICGQPPFTEGTLAQRLLAHQVKTPPAIESLRADVPASLAIILRKMMEKKPADRYASAAELENVLFKWIDENADVDWRRAHAGLYGTRVSDSSAVSAGVPVAAVAIPVANIALPIASVAAPLTSVAIPFAKPVAVATAEDQPNSEVSAPISRPAVSKPNSSKVPLPQTVSSGTDESNETSLNQFFSTLAQSTSATTPSKTKAKSSPKLPAIISAKTNLTDTGKEISTEPEVAAASSFPNFGETEFPKIIPAKTKPKSGTTKALPALNSLGSRLTSLRSLSNSVVARSKPLLEQWKRKIPLSKMNSYRTIGGIVGISVALLMAIYHLSSMSGTSGSDVNKQSSRGPFPADKREIVVGGKHADYKTIGDALVAVRDRYRPSPHTNDRMVVRISDGVYKERIQVDGRTKSWPEGITLRGEGTAEMAPLGDEPVIRLANVSAFVIENLVINGDKKSVSIELADDLHETRLSHLAIRDFAGIGVLCKGAQGLSFGNSQTQLEALSLEPTGTVSTGIRLQEGSDNDANNINIRGCRFLNPMAVGIAIEGRAPYGIAITECIFNKTTDAVRFEGKPILKSIQISNNSFRETKTGIQFSNLPSEMSSDIAIRRNLFIKPFGPEAIVQQGFDENGFRSMLSAEPPGLENNWSDRAKSTLPVNGEIPYFFENGGSQGGRDFALASTDPKQEKFLAPTEKSPQREVPGSQPTDKKWVGAIGP